MAAIKLSVGADSGAAAAALKQFGQHVARDLAGLSDVTDDLRKKTAEYVQSTDALTRGQFKAEVEALAAAFEEVTQRTGSAEKAADLLSDEMTELAAKGRLIGETLPDGMARLNADARRAATGVKEVSGGLDKHLKQALFGAATAGTFMGNALVGAIGMAKQAIGSFISESGRMAAEFEARFAEVETLFGGQTSLAALGVSAGQAREQIAAMAGTLGTATELTAGLYEAISAGVEKGKAIAFVGDAAQLAVAGVSDVRTAVDILTTVLNAYGLEADQAGIISDQLFKTVELGKTTLPELAGTLGRVIPIAATLGVSFDQVGAAMATLTAGGLQTEIAATALTGAFNALIQNSDKLKGAGVNITQVLAEEGIGGAMRALQAATGGSVEAFKEFVPESRALTGVLAMAGTQSETLATNLDKVRDATGATGPAFATMAATMESRLKELGARYDEVKIKTGEATNEAKVFWGEAGLVLLNAFADLRPNLESVSDAMHGVADAETQAAELAATLAERMKDVAAETVEAEVPARTLAEILGDVQQELDDAAVAAAKVAPELGEAASKLVAGLGPITSGQIEVEVSNLAEAFRSVRASTGDSAIAAGLLRAEIERLVAQQEKLGIDAPPRLALMRDLLRDQDAATKDLAASHETVASAAEEVSATPLYRGEGKRHFTDLVDATEEWNNSLHDSAAAAHDAEQALYRTAKAQMALSDVSPFSAGSERVEAPEEFLVQALARLEGTATERDVRNRLVVDQNTIGALQQFALSLKQGDLKALDNIITSVLGNAQVLTSASTPLSLEVANNMRGVAQVMTQIVSQLEGLRDRGEARPREPPPPVAIDRNTIRELAREIGSVVSRSGT